MTILAIWNEALAAACHPAFEAPPAKPAVNVGPGGVEFPIYSTSDFEAAKTTMRGLSAGGHVMRFKQSITNAQLQARGPNVSAGGNDLPNGVPGNHNKITADPGVELIGPSGDLNNAGTLDVYGVAHTDVIGVRIRGGQFGLRCMNLTGTAGSHCVIGWNEISHTGHAHLAMQGWFASPWTPSAYVDGIANNCHDVSAAVSSTEHKFSEGIYLGRGSAPGWVDRTNNIRLAHNELWSLTSDGIDWKPGVTAVTIELNYLHNLNLVSGGPLAGISCSYADVANSGAPPSDITTLNGLVRWNRVHGMPAFWPIIVGFGGVDVYQNLLWDYSAVPGIYLRSEQTFKTAAINIDGNTCAGGGYHDDAANPGPARVVNASANIRDGTYSGQFTHAGLTDFVGPLTGNADHGEGPGSGWLLKAGSGANNTGSIITSLTTRCPATVNHLGAMPAYI